MSLRSFSRASITRRLFNTPLAVLPSTAAIVLGAVGPRFDVGQLFMHASDELLGLEQLQALAADERTRISAKRGLDQSWPDLPAARVLDIDQGVAHINIRGELVAENGGGVSPDSGFTGYDAVMNAWTIAQRDPDVRGIIVDEDSPGGEVTDLNELTAMMMADRGRKPTRAIIRGLGASAGYAIASCCDEITVQPLSYSGSIGIITMHADFSRQLEQAGIKVTLIQAGAHKADANPFEALPDDVRAAIQSDIDVAYGLFVAQVASARGLSEDAVRGTQARVYQGQSAVEVGLADKVMSWRDSQAEFVAAVNGRKAAPQRKAGAAARTSQEQTMADTPTDAPAANAQPDTLTQAFAGLTTLAIAGGPKAVHAVTAALAAASVEGVTVNAAPDAPPATAGDAAAERTRVLALTDLCPETTMSASLRTAIEGGTDAGAFAIGLAQAAKSRGASMSDLRAGAVQPEQLPEGRGNAAGGAAKPLTGAARSAGIIARAAALGHSAVAHLAQKG